ncbi:MAG: methyltransferase domain-containing protein [Acidobacteria bacterium]|nr:methyltransferase domain-containing protein [Acidobacteriota bacterium]
MAEMKQEPFHCPVCGGEPHDAGKELGGYALSACGGCGLRYAPGAFGTDVDYSAVYEGAQYRQDQVDDLLAGLGDPGRFARMLTYRAFFRRISPFGERRLLDVGCGVGRFGLAAASRGWAVRGVDRSERAVDIARKHTNLVVGTEETGDLESLGERFEVVTAFEVLEHLSDPLGFLDGIRRLLKPGGRFFATVPNWGAPSVQAAVRPDWLPPIHLCFHTVSSLVTLGTRSGFRSARVGVIHAEPLTWRPRPLAGWIVHRLAGRPNEPVGLWLDAEA